MACIVIVYRLAGLGSRMGIIHISFARNFCFSISFLVLVVTTSVLGCSSVPAQEMSDARQAIRAAQNEGVSSQTSLELADALRLIKLAQQKLESGKYEKARINALTAKQKALDARQNAIDKNLR